MIDMAHVSGNAISQKGARRRARYIALLDLLTWVDRSASSPLKNSMGCLIVWMRCQNSDASRCFASRAEFSSALGEVEKCHDGIFQQAAKI
jgi:hypothetical protein